MIDGTRNASDKDLLQQLAGALGADIQRLFVFFSLYENALDEGVLTGKIKQLIALAMAVGNRSNEAISYHVNAALDTGASRDEIMETVSIAVLMGGVPSILAGAEVLATVSRFEAQKLTSSAKSSNT